MGCFVANLLLAALFCFAHLRSNAQLLPKEEVQTLQTIAAKLKNNYWSVSRNSCTVGSGLNVAVTSEFSSNVTCDCSFKNNTICHVKTIELKSLNLSGVMPAEFGDLSYLEKIDLTRNYINGSIPISLSKAPLTFISLLDNRISGSIPKEIGDITNLQALLLDDNGLGGSLPESLGNLSHLSRLLLSANNFIGTIPPTFGKLKNLTDLRVDGSQLSGKIPDFIGNLTKLTRLDIQGTLMEGPIPQTISSLKNLTELRISDLNGSSMSFPNIQNLKNLRYLILRNCLINDSIPEYIGDFSDLKTLDLSFNMLRGEIPQSFESLLQLEYLFLTNNSLTGTVPPAIQESKQNFDLSYNNFTGSAISYSCIQQNVNLISSYSPMESNLIPWCLKKDLTCSSKPQYNSLFINCGGSSTRYEGNDYEGDLTPGGPSTFSSFSEKWAYSSTGTYMNNENVNFIPSNTGLFNNSDGEIYGTARVAPLSLNYYGLCLREGSYTVRLHFAEILYSNDETFSGLGRRLFDVSLQGSLVLKDFNIMEEAKGANKGIIKEFTNVNVSGTTLEIHLYWSGKGTTAVPDRGVYGPLISAISVTPNFNVGHFSLPIGVIVGIVVACCVFVALILVVLWMKGCLGGKHLQDKELQELELQTGSFTLRQIKAATENFYPGNKIGEGGFGPVYKGVLQDGSVIAVKQLSAKSKQGNREFINEIGMISAVQHPNLARLYGCCIEGNQLLLIYEFMENNSLARALFGREQEKLQLDWPTRNKICLGIARGLSYLHEESRLKIVHRDIKATNVLLDKNLNAKISDFGLAKLNEEEDTHISTRIAGTVGYMAPEYAMRGYLTPKADIYSFGVVALEVVSGKSNTNYRPKEELLYLLDWAYVLQEEGNLLDLVDPSLGSNYSREEATRMLHLALLCTNPSPTLRPAMSSVVKMLEGRIPVQTPVVKRSAEEQDVRFKAFEKLMHERASSTFSQQSQEQRDVSRDGPGVDSSTTTSSMGGDPSTHLSC